MRTRRILVVAATVLAAGVLGAVPAQAGGWSETVLDPVPARIEAKVTYTWGFWVLQHGSYPFKGGDLGAVALTATDGEGAALTFPATKSVTEGHYSAEVVFPHDGRWQIGTAQDKLMPDVSVAEVTVPGAVRILPSEVRGRAAYEWGAVRPSFPPAADNAQIVAPGGYPSQQAVEPRSARSPAPAETGSSGLPVEVTVAGGLALLVVALGVGRRYVRGRRRTS